MRITDFQQQSRTKTEPWLKAHPVAEFFLSHRWLALFYGTYLYLYELQILREHLSIFHPVLVIWAAAVVAYDAVTGQGMFSAPFFKLALLFLTSAAVTTLINLPVGGIQNIKTYVLVLLAMAAFYPLCATGDAEARGKNLLLSGAGTMVICFFASLAAVIMYLADCSVDLSVAGKSCTIGILEYSKTALVVPGIYADTNHAASFAVIAALLSLMLLRECRKGLFKKPWANKAAGCFAAVNIAVQALYFPLANSRGGWLSLIAALLLAGYFCLRYKFRAEAAHVRCIKAIAGAALAAVLCCGALLALRTGCAQIYEHSAVTEQGEAAVGFDKTGESGYEVTAGRFKLWNDALRLYGKRPVFGISPGNSGYYSSLFFDKNSLSSGKAIHNSYLDLLVDYGAVGFVLLMGFFLCCALRVLRQTGARSSGCEWGYFPVLCGVVMIACSAFFLSCIFINCTAMYFSLLIMTGYLAAPREDKI